MCSGCSNAYWFIQSLRLLLLWENGHRRFSEHVGRSVRLTLAKIPNQIAEIFKFDHPKYTKTGVLSWIQSGSF